MGTLEEAMKKADGSPSLEGVDLNFERRINRFKNLERSPSLEGVDLNIWEASGSDRMCRSPSLEGVDLNVKRW